MTTERALPCLARGWRTPDPSPTRAAADLPPCKPRSWFTVTEEADDQPPAHVDSNNDDNDADTVVGKFLIEEVPQHRGRSQVRRSDLLSESCGSYTTFIASRTPSPAPYSFASQDDRMAMGVLFSKGSISASTKYAESECSSGFSPRGSFSLADERTPAFKAPTPPAVKPVAAWHGPAVPPPPPVPPVLREVLGMPDDCPSVGSMNHPHGCADFCKYAKKAKGCKDGDACVRCHICTCKKPKQVAQSSSEPSKTKQKNKKNINKN
eukprot:CAMPEP_0206426278 /NCGR_PEP_ID=MMETSP0324_2-20121206/4280_1 /ASSEMBLY_ACC=CAM_ASM_000836 /TAXON_ID=2866 /ORGANISM="Crypthecodinium cohnii, Strain Seligo" /LENGTH=264 /DNA_ID=CAMNT_0053891197 /DNA_START=163 /DNA_END=957 /DNA_ORIENTATION=-